MQPCRLYSHVCFHSGSNTWVVQRKSKFVGSHKDQHEAAKIAAKEFGVSCKSLLLKNAKHAPAVHRKSVFQYVNFHARRRVWYAQCPGRFLGTFQTELEAAHAVIDAKLAKSLQELKRHRRTTNSGISPGGRLAMPPQHATRSAKATAKGKPAAKEKGKAKNKSKAKAKPKTRVQLLLSKERFQDLWKIYRDYEGGTAKARIPGDLEDATRGIGGMPRRFTAIHILLKCPDHHYLHHYFRH